MVNTCTGIKFDHYRKITSVGASGDLTVAATTLIQHMNAVGIMDMSMDSRAIKLYIPYAHTKSEYVPLGLTGPVVKMTITCANAADFAAWSNVYANDQLWVIEYDYPMFNGFIGTSAGASCWWIDVIEADTQSAWCGRYKIDLDLYQKDAVSYAIGDES